MIFETYQKGSYHIIRINEVIQISSDIKELEDIVNKLLEKSIKNIAIHFKDGSYIYSGSGAVLVRCFERIRDHKGTLACINVDIGIRTFLASMHNTSEIKICASDEDLEIQDN